MTSTKCPVVLVHGWNSHPGIWNRLVPLLKDRDLPVWNFDHSGLKESVPAESACALHDFIRSKRQESQYTGPINIVCHSMGTAIGRYLAEVLDRNNQGENIRQLIGIGPPNNGSALAELFSSEEHGEEIIRSLEGVFVPKGFVPEEDVIVQEFRPGSRTMQDLQSAGIREDISYRILVAVNSSHAPEFFPWFLGKTWEALPNGKWHQTFMGDGVVAASESALPGIPTEIISTIPHVPGQRPDQYCHIFLPRAPEILNRICRYLEP